MEHARPHTALPDVPLPRLQHFRSTRELFGSLAAHRMELARLHRALALRVGPRADCAVLFERMAEADECLARGWSSYAADPDPVFDTFLQYGARAPTPPLPDPQSPCSILRWASALDDGVRALWRPLRASAGARRLHELLDDLDDQIESRRRARHRWVTLGETV